MFVSQRYAVDARFQVSPVRHDTAKVPMDELRALLAQARRSSFYKDRIDEPKHWDYAAWKRLPLTTKTDLRQNYPLGLLAEPMHRVASYHESSGTSGDPTATLFSERDWDDIVTRFTRSQINLGAHDVVFIKTPYSLVTTAHQMERAARLVGATVVPADNRSRNMPYAKVVRLLQRLPITVCWCLPTEAILWASAAEAVGLNPKTDFPHLRAFFVAGEPLTEAKRRRISELWGGVRVVQDYGSTETGSLAGECSAGRLHFWADRVFAEVIQTSSGTAQLTGEGTLVVTPLYREAMPLVRYHTEDVVRLSHGTCTCGWSLPTIQVLGRASDRQSQELSARDLEDVVYGLPAAFDIRFWRARMTELGIQLEITSGTPSEDTAADELACRIFRRFGVKAQVETVPLSSFIPIDVLTADAGFQKPRFLYGQGEDWSRSHVYA